uniref:Uncharacterized protein n=1 Tax=Anguilla anguilla TaxID=7936 RepID=A0A0E9RE52_ANGAN
MRRQNAKCYFIILLTWRSTIVLALSCF